MIKTLKLQKAIIAFILGALALVAYKVMSVNKMESSNYMLSFAGILFIVGALMLIYPILFAKKDKEGCVELDPEIQEEMASAEAQTALIEEPITTKTATIGKVEVNEKMGEA
nr:isoleucyl-tRNA synthetase [Pedobacter panaciterrae]